MKFTVGRLAIKKSELTDCQKRWISVAAFEAKCLFQMEGGDGKEPVRLPGHAVDEELIACSEALVRRGRPWAEDVYCHLMASLALSAAELAVPDEE